MTLLSILQNEFSILQRKCKKLEIELDLCSLLHSHQCTEIRQFALTSMKFIADLYNQKLYSDVTVTYPNGCVYAHKFVLEAHCGFNILKSCTVNDDGKYFLNLEEFDADIVLIVTKYFYMIRMDDSLDVPTLMKIVHLAKRFEFDMLLNSCEDVILPQVNMSNAISVYKFARSMQPRFNKLMNISSRLIFENWNAVKSDDFSSLTVEENLDLFNCWSSSPLIKAIEIGRIDLVYSCILRYCLTTPELLNTIDVNGQCPLSLALRLHYIDIAKLLIENGSNVNLTLNSGLCLLHHFISHADFESAKFLIENQCDVTSILSDTSENALHLLAKLPLSELPESTLDQYKLLADELILKGTDICHQNMLGNTSLHECVLYRNVVLFQTILKNDAKLEDVLSLYNNENETLFWISVKSLEHSQDENDKSVSMEFVNSLVKAGCLQFNRSETEQSTYLHKCIKAGYNLTASYLIDHLTKFDDIDEDGQTVLHIAAQQGDTHFVLKLLHKGANCVIFNKANESPLLCAIKHNYKETALQMLDWIANQLDIHSQLSFDSSGELSNALLNGWFTAVSKMIEIKGPDLLDRNGQSLLHDAIDRLDNSAFLFLLDKCNILRNDKESIKPLLIHAVRKNDAVMVKAICDLKHDLKFGEENPIWIALVNESITIAKILVRTNLVN
ncbi:hypothetical protein GJ496_003920 [Pomphorhynchus laevis]|nr:hypothetical protein GJ496_003920 [Pomphorhynchus laevis]